MIVYDLANVTKSYAGQARPANNRVTLQIHEAEIFGLLGENGAGKTTLVRQMVNLVRPTQGSISFYGRDVAADPTAVALRVGYMPQESLSLNNLTAGEALYFTAHLRGLSRRDAQAERDRLLETWQIGRLRDKYSTRLSGGERRLLRLAVAMAGRPPVLILDEPTNDLDPIRRKLAWEVLRRANTGDGATIVFITHDAIEAEKVIQRVGIMRDGELAAVGRPGELKRSVDRKLRLELFFAPDAPPALPPGLPYKALEPGRWLVYLEWDQVAAALNALDSGCIDDFRLHSATLEDLYLHYATSY